MRKQTGMIVLHGVVSDRFAAFQLKGLIRVVEEQFDGVAPVSGKHVDDVLRGFAVRDA